MSDRSSSSAPTLAVVPDGAQPEAEVAGGAGGVVTTVVATVLGVTEDGLLVDLDGQQRVARIATPAPVEDAIGREVLVSFIGGDPCAPVVTGLLRAPRRAAEAGTVEIDADALCLEARRELVLRCGKGSIRLTKDGRVVIDGVHLVSRAKGANRIRGGTVHLN